MIDVRHEVSAAFAADAVSRVSGTVGVAIVTAGPGLSNTITAVKNAQLAQSPLVLLGGAAPTIFKGRGALQDIDQVAMFKPHVKWTASITCVQDMVPMLTRAFQEAQSGVPGPVFVECPLDTLYPEKIVKDELLGALDKMKGVEGIFLRWYLKRHYARVFGGMYDVQPAVPLPISFPRPSPDQVEYAARLLKRAKRPLIMVGSQAMLHAVPEAVMADAVRSLGAPVYLSSMARGLLNADGSGVQMRHKRRDALRDADVVILAGVACDFRLEYGRHITSRSTYISANRSPVDLKKNRTPDVAVLGDPAMFLEQLAEAFGRLAGPVGDARRPDWAPWFTKLGALQETREAAISKDSLIDAGDGKMNALNVLRQIDELMDDDAIMIGDGGDFVGSASYILRPRGPLGWLDPGVFGTLGVGGGFAMAVKACQPEQEVWVFFGDGSFGYSLIEFDTYVRAGIPVIAVIGNDAAWMQMMRGQVDMFDDETAVVLNYTNYEDTVRGFGAAGILIKTHDEVEAKVKEAKALAKAGTPVVINLLLSRNADFRKGSIAV